MPNSSLIDRIKDALARYVRLTEEQRDLLDAALPFFAEAKTKVPLGGSGEEFS